MNDTPYRLKVILLAAGKSERFKAIKLLAKVKNQAHSNSLIQHVLQQITESLSELAIDKNNLHIATGKYHKQIAEVIGEQFTITYCSQANLGMGHTIAQSVERIVNIDDTTSHIMITLADQVALTADDYTQLIEQYLLTPEKLICVKSGCEIMPPAIFPRRYFNQLMNLTGDKGAKMLLNKNKKYLQEVFLPNAAIDIDTQQALINWQNTN